jgi:hypothetical protein
MVASTSLCRVWPAVALFQIQSWGNFNLLCAPEIHSAESWKQPCRARFQILRWKSSFWASPLYGLLIWVGQSCKCKSHFPLCSQYKRCAERCNKNRSCFVPLANVFTPVPKAILCRFAVPVLVTSCCVHFLPILLTSRVVLCATSLLLYFAAPPAVFHGHISDAQNLIEPTSPQMSRPTPRSDQCGKRLQLR